MLEAPYVLNGAGRGQNKQSAFCKRETEDAKTNLVAESCQCEQHKGGAGVTSPRFTAKGGVEYTVPLSAALGGR